MNLKSGNSKLWFWGFDFLFNFMLFIIKRLNLDPFRLNSYRFLVQFLLFESPFKLSRFPLDSSPRVPLPDFTFGKFINGHSAISNDPSYMAHLIGSIWYGVICYGSYDMVLASEPKSEVTSVKGLLPHLVISNIWQMC